LELKNCIKRTTYENEITLDYITLNDKDKFKKHWVSGRKYFEFPIEVKYG
jgi:hypothetical protein